MELGEFLKRELSNGSAWNCSTLPADWCIVGPGQHPDFAAEWRDVTEPAECDAAPRAAGSLLALWDRGIGDALPVVTAVEPGDIAVVSAHALEAGAIWTGDRWAMKAARGMHFLAADAVALVKAWRP